MYFYAYSQSFTAAVHALLLMVVFRILIFIALIITDEDSFVRLLEIESKKPYISFTDIVIIKSTADFRSCSSRVAGRIHKTYVTLWHCVMAADNKFD